MCAQSSKEKKDYDRNVVDEQRDDQPDGPAAFAVITLHPAGDANRDQDDSGETSESDCARQFKRYSDHQRYYLEGTSSIARPANTSTKDLVLSKVFIGQGRSA